MPLSKKRDRERRRQSRLDVKTDAVVVQPNILVRSYKQGMQYKQGEIVTLQGRLITIPEIDADGNIVPEFT